MEEKQEKKGINKDAFLDELLYIFRTVVITSVMTFMIFNFLFTPITIDGPSMTPTLENQQWGLSSLITNYIGKYKRFDVVVVYYKEKDMRLVKRIVGLPGDVVEYQDDKLYINGKHVKENFFDEEYVRRQTYEGKTIFTDNCGPYILGEDEYFVIGDNRPHSTDSRTLRPFKKEEILSKSVLVLWPLNKIHFVGNGK